MRDRSPKQGTKLGANRALDHWHEPPDFIKNWTSSYDPRLDSKLPMYCETP
jgi:hypothetical protein